ncbi:hypothetical protein AWE51_17665 [Aquimarina aggregata]|uniref:3-keto-alpha-glucoside-1,2-lyase/3-keto-2-hydroxy-glucal hydratase domain-containing protein n=1 Tax=Aquimarina aggregata TaxID=1642818 RepID=A0A162X2R8_9FLAO|nr:DUF1080 domain-containing protein [Aquimarina aggregata]KZS38384.1 hypothetical protein AWE51_17665 [Aquimarina aggregata]
MSNKHIIFIGIIISIVACNQKTKNNIHTEEWISLFNGTDLNDWDIKISGYELNHNYKETFIVQDSMIRVQYDNYETFDNSFGHLYYKTPFSYYKLSFDYRFTGEQLQGGVHWNIRNSGVMLHSQSAMSNELNQDFPVSIELQTLGGLNKGKRTTANVCTPGTAVEIDGIVDYTHCINSSSKTYHGDQWVHIDAIIMGGEYMEFKVNGDMVLRFEKPQITGGKYSAESKETNLGNFGIERDLDYWLSKAGTILTDGYIALQAESHPIDFKNIKLLNLCGCMDPKATNYKSYYIKNLPKTCTY